MILQPTKTVEFDPSNKKHRLAVKAFLRRNAWCDSPYRFSYDPAYGSVADQVRDKMLKWYMEREFAVKKPVEKKTSISVFPATGTKKIALAS